MSLAAQLLRAESIGVRELKNHLSAVLHRGKPRIVTERNKPRHFLVPYEDMMEIIEIIEELSDPKLLVQLAQTRESYRKGKWVPLETTAKDLRLKA
ncbi:MAG: hypothetical protein HY748_07075 [Elusimicrobia bacterium]|nr:hypothetical protein [Elusimicrobiota bacterium]